MSPTPGPPVSPRDLSLTDGPWFLELASKCLVLSQSVCTFQDSGSKLHLLTKTGARTADTIKNGIIPPDSFRDNAGVQMLAFTCALAGASMWVMWCTKHSAHVSSTYSLISAVAGVGVATAGASQVQWGWNGGKGLGAIFAGEPCPC